MYQYHYCTFVSHFLKSFFIAFFYLMPCCWAYRQQYKAKHISHWKYLPHPLSESVLFLLQLYFTQRHIHEITHNFDYFEGMEKTSNRRKTSKKSRSRNIFFTCSHTEIKLYSSRKWSECSNQTWEVIWDVMQTSILFFNTSSENAYMQFYLEWHLLC